MNNAIIFYKLTVSTLPVTAFAAIIAVSLVISSAYAQQASDTRAINQIIPVSFDADSTVCPNGEIIQVSGYVHVVSQFIQDQTGDHFVTHVNFQDVRGVGLTTGNQYVVQQSFNSPSNFDIRSGGATGSATQVTAFQIISLGPVQSAPNFTEHALLHITVNANGQVTAVVDNLNAECRQKVNKKKQAITTRNEDVLKNFKGKTIRIILEDAEE